MESRDIQNIRQSAVVYDELRSGTENVSVAGAESSSGAVDGQLQPRIVGGRQKVDAQNQLHEYREKLARDMGKRDGTAHKGEPAIPGAPKVSPIQEETTTTNSPSAGPTTTTSTDSCNTIPGGATPGWTAGTPSYPFPRMTTPGAVPSALHKPFTTLSPTVAPQPSQGTFDALRAQDHVLSYPSTPASTMTFLPHGHSQLEVPSPYPTPSLYDMSLMLSSEPGLDAWWKTVVQIMTGLYRAERITLAVPADSTDIENVPWGQKASYNARQEDELSLGYLARGSSLIFSSAEDQSEVPLTGDDVPSRRDTLRPGLQSRHSFTSYEERKEKMAVERPLQSLRRPPPLGRSQSSHPTSAPHEETGHLQVDDQPALNRKALEQHDALEKQQSVPSWEATFSATESGPGKVLDVLQALDYEADPLIDHNGVVRVLERGKAIALTRSYPYLSQSTNELQSAEAKQGAHGRSPDATRKRTRRARADSTASHLSTILGGAKLSSSGRGSKGQRQGKKPGPRTEDDAPRPPTPMYEEYEQAPPSPWSQSPAPSPAVRADPNENPFFTDAMVDEESFNPSPGSKDYSSIPPPETIGVDNSCTVLHIPLVHPLLSKPNAGFRLDTTVMEQKTQARNRKDVRFADGTVPSQTPPDTASKPRHAPIAILSILSSVIPYPTNLRRSLEHLAPHLATSFSLCRHYTNLETEVNGLQKRRPNTHGFGAVGPDGRPLADSAALASLGYLPVEEPTSRASCAGSLTSPSEYSAPSRSAAQSPSVTPSWDISAAGVAVDSRAPLAASPLGTSGDSYFSAKPKSTSGVGESKAVRNHRETSLAEKRSSHRSLTGRAQIHEAAFSNPANQESQSSESAVVHGSEDPVKASAKHKRRHSRDLHDLLRTRSDKEDSASGHGSNRHRHTQLHSYGADFASTFQSLPPSSTIGKGVPQSQVPPRSGSATQSEMMPPSDKLKNLILDSLPAHVFIALPQTGEIVWVNSRFLVYRGQTSSDLAADPWGSLHPEDREDYLRAWSHSVRTGEQFSRAVRIRRFDGHYRWHYARAVASKDKRGVILQFLGSYMDIHEQHVAELKAARQEEIEASEAKHRLLANLIPQIIFTATEVDGVAFANEQWLSYTGQSFDDALGLGFMDFVHPDDLAKCQIPANRPATPLLRGERKSFLDPATPVTGRTALDSAGRRPRTPVDGVIRGTHRELSRNSSSGSDSMFEIPAANLIELARKGVIKVGTDSNGRLSYTTEIRLRSKSGEYRWHLIRCVEIDNVNLVDGESSYFGSATDINDLKLLETKLKEAMESKGRFLSNMSHEIRTPLIGISGMVSFLQDTTLTEEQRDYTNTIQTSANSLLMIINDILDLSKVDAGMMKLNFEWFHTRSLIEDVNELVSTMAIAKRLELNYIVEEDVPMWIKGDRVRMRQVLLNVIGNAIKFTSQGEVFSRCKVVVPERAGLENNENNEVMLAFSVIDTGRGFTQKESEMIFKPFSQIDGSSTRQHGGSGLGLVISRQLVELHGGKMEGTAVLGKGSIFTFTAKFGLPSEVDRPDGSASSRMMAHSAEDLPQMVVRTKPLRGFSPAVSVSSTDADYVSPPVVASSGSSDPSIQSGRSQVTARSSMSSLNVGLVRFSEAARASGQDLSSMKLEMPTERRSPGLNSPTTGPNVGQLASEFRPPPIYSILIVCPQLHSREATTKHIEMTLPKEIPHQITALASVREAQELVGVDDPVIFTHVVINLPSSDEIVQLSDVIAKSAMAGKATLLILSDSVQRQVLMRQITGTKYEDMLSDQRVTYIYKPVKPSRFGVIFDPSNRNELSIDRNRSSAQRLVETQRQSYLEVEKRMGNKGYLVLLVEDNLVNQKVLQKYLKKVGVAVDLATDGVECTEKVFANPHGRYSLILVSGPPPPSPPCDHTHCSFD